MLSGVISWYACVLSSYGVSVLGYVFSCYVCLLRVIVYVVPVLVLGYIHVCVVWLRV